MVAIIVLLYLFPIPNETNPSNIQLDPLSGIQLNCGYFRDRDQMFLCARSISFLSSYFS
jgi:hypothetical protein